MKKKGEILNGTPNKGGGGPRRTKGDSIETGGGAKITVYEIARTRKDLAPHTAPLRYLARRAGENDADQKKGARKVKKQKNMGRNREVLIPSWHYQAQMPLPADQPYKSEKGSDAIPRRQRREKSRREEGWEICQDGQTSIGRVDRLPSITAKV